MKILISAAETSSDAHGAELLKALRAELKGEPLDAFGLGGPKLQAEGLRVIADARDLLAMGFAEILSRLPAILRALWRLAECARRERPDVAVVIDYPDFHFRLARHLVRARVPVVYFIPPKVWVWRKGRIRFLREYFAKLLCILPFEEEFYRREGVPVAYIGSPLVDELPLNLSKAEARARLGIPPDANVLLAMPGSRPSEIKRHLALMLAAIAQARPKLGFAKLVVLMPIPEMARTAISAEAFRDWSSPELEIRVSEGDAHLCMRAADVGMIKSGTSTLEAAMMGCVHFIVYKTNFLTRWIFEYLIRYPGPVGLVNLVAECPAGSRYLVAEFISARASVDRLANEIIDLFTNAERREETERGLVAVREKMLGDPATRGQSPSARAAREVILVARAAAVSARARK